METISESQTEFETFLRQCVELQASDLHLSANNPATFRIQGRLQSPQPQVYSAEFLRQLASVIMDDHQRDLFAREHTIDLAVSIPSGERFRVNIYQERGHVALAIRQLEQTFKKLVDLYLPSQLGNLAELRDGLVLVTGPTGSGKTTTLSTLIHQINCTRSCHILTIEDPIEYIHPNVKSLVHQRELYADVPTFAQAVRASLREDPDVILVGEMRDTETMRAAITAAETGHLVFSTLHTGDTVGAIDRMIGVFPADEQESLRQQLSMVLRAVIAQRLLPSRIGKERYPAIEILRVTPAVANLIRVGKPQQIYSSIEAGVGLGMQTMEQSLATLVSQRMVNPEDAKLFARDPQSFEDRLKLLKTQSVGFGGV